MALMPVEEALRQVLEGAAPLDIEEVALAQARGRILAGPIAARRTQPPFAASAMDGYALRAVDVTPGAHLTVVGEAAAGHGFSGTVGPGRSVRIFTGAPVPDGTDAVVIQEMVTREGNMITVEAAPQSGANIRGVGLDFTDGAPALAAGMALGPRDLALAAAMNHAVLTVRRRPRVAILATGDEVVMPGQPIGEHQIVASNNFALAAMAEAAGASLVDLGIAADNFPALEAAIRRARAEKADILVTIGGASVGDHDLVQTVLRNEGMSLGFWKIAMRPGKPMMHGSLGPMRILGLPGNPVSAIVCGILFLLPLIHRLAGRAEAGLPMREARFAIDWPANDQRQDYLRARMDLDGPGAIPNVTPFALQDSSLVGVLQQADCLVLRPSFAESARAGETCRIIDLRAAGL